MSATEIYEASQIKRHRATKAETQQRRDKLYEIVEAMRPMTVRQVFYQASVRGVVEKSESGYVKVQTDLVWMRRNAFRKNALVYKSGDGWVRSRSLPYSWLTDSTRWQRKPRSYGSPEEALRETAKFYRKALWDEIDAHVEIWLEKDALAGVVYPITEEFDVPLMVARGYASLSFLAETANALSGYDCPIYLYHLGDYDPSGVNAAEKIEETLRELAPNADIHFARIGVTLAQIRNWGLPTRPTKTMDTRAKGFSDESVELDSIDPDRLRKLVRAIIEQHLPRDKFAVLKAAEASEREFLTAWAGRAAP